MDSGRCKRPYILQHIALRSRSSRDRLVVRTLRCGRNNPGSNPGHGSGGSSTCGIFFSFLYKCSYTLCTFTTHSISLLKQLIVKRY